MKPEKTTLRRAEGLAPNPKLRLQGQFREAMRFRQFFRRTEAAYWNWIRQYVFFHAKRHPREMGKPEIEVFLSHLTTDKQVVVAAP